MTNWVNLMTKEDFENTLIEMLAERKNLGSMVRLLNEELKEWEHVLDSVLEQIEKYETAWHLGERYSAFHLRKIQEYIDVIQGLKADIRSRLTNQFIK